MDATRTARWTAVVTAVIAGALAPLAGEESPYDGTPAHRRCDSCHAAASAPEQAGTPGPEVCTGCHTDYAQPHRLPDGAEETSGHHAWGGPALAPGGAELDQFDCLSCHDAHANGRRSQLREDLPVVADPLGTTLDEISRFCLSCHWEFAQIHGGAGHYVRHPVGLRLNDGRRRRALSYGLKLASVGGNADRPDEVIACATCHEVHVGSNPDLLVWTPDDIVFACTTCHPMESADRRYRERLAANR